MPDIKSRLDHVRGQIRAAAISCGRKPEAVTLVAVSKTVPAERVLKAIKAGATTLGENYIQEAGEKINSLREHDVSWHYIGHLQSNKAKYAVKLFDLIHSVDSLKLAKELDKRARAIDKLQKILVQVNISGEETKSGIDTAKVFELVQNISLLKNLSIRGLMTMPPYFNAPEKVRPYFKALKDLQSQIEQDAIRNVRMMELSMGMSGDFETAIQEGATLVRVGTSIFGERH